MPTPCFCDPIALCPYHTNTIPQLSHYRYLFLRLWDVDAGYSEYQRAQSVLAILKLLTNTDPMVAINKMFPQDGESAESILGGAFDELKDKLVRCQ